MNTRMNWLPEVFNDFFNIDMPVHYATSKAASPSVNVLERVDGYEMQVAAPGLTKDDFSVSLKADGNLTLKMGKQSEKQEDNAHYVRREWSYAKFEQTYTLPDDVDKDKIEAHVADGVLTIDLPKKMKSEEEKAKECKVIEIK